MTAGQIDVPADIEVLNPDHVICTLDDGASIRMELTVQNGKGYVAAELNRPEDAPIGLIAVDALYSPVKKVAYRVEPTRQGQSLDYDKLLLEDVKLKAELKDKLKSAGVSAIEIERPGNKLRIIIKTARPGIGTVGWSRRLWDSNVNAARRSTAAWGSS